MSSTFTDVKERLAIRRVVKPQPPERVRRLIRQNDGAYVEATPGDMPLTGEWECRCPYGKPGDVLYVREARAAVEIISVRAERVRNVWVWVIEFAPALAPRP